MAFIQEEGTSRGGLTLADRVRRLEKEKTLAERTAETEKEKKPFKWPFQWKRKFRGTRSKKNNEKVLVIFLNKKNQVESPKYMPIFDGNMVVWRNKPYEFDPRAVWTMQGMKGNPQVYLIKEIDRRPVKNKFGQKVYVDAAVSNMDIEEIRERGDSTESDEFLIKAALKAQTSTAKKNFNIVMLVIIGLIVLGVAAWFLYGK